MLLCELEGFVVVNLLLYLPAICKTGTPCDLVNTVSCL